jgi:hypothetical protein
MNGEFTIKSEDRYKELEARRVNSGEDGEDDEYSLEVTLYDDCLPFWFDSEAQAKEFVEKFTALIEGFEVEQVTRRIKRLEEEKARLRELLRQSRHLYGRNGKESVGLFEDWRRRVEEELK